MNPIDDALKEIIKNRVGDLPTLPDVALKLLELSDDDDFDMKELVRVVSHDQAILSRILKVANSSYYGFSRKVSSIDHAITLLGIEAIQSLALSMHVHDYFDQKRKGGPFAGNKFWHHSVAVAVIAKELARALKMGSPDKYFTAGLLHDLGKLFLMDSFPEQYIDLVRDAERRSVSLNAEEETAFGYDHAQAGAILLDHWNFPEDIISAVGDHHCDFGQIKSESALIVMLADSVALETGLGGSGNTVPYENLDEALDILNVPKETWEKFRQEYLEEGNPKLMELIESIS